MSLLDWAGALAGPVASLFGSSSRARAQRELNAQNQANYWTEYRWREHQANDQNRMYWDAVHNTINHRVQDARRSGISPLAALGMPGAQPPSTATAPLHRAGGVAAAPAAGVADAIADFGMWARERSERRAQQQHDLDMFTKANRAQMDLELHRQRSTENALAIRERAALQRARQHTTPTRPALGYTERDAIPTHVWMLHRDGTRSQVPNPIMSESYEPQNILGTGLTEGVNTLRQFWDSIGDSADDWRRFMETGKPPQ